MCTDKTNEDEIQEVCY